MLIKQGLIQELKTELQLAVLSFKNWNWYSVPQIPIRAQRPSGTLKVTLFCCYCKKCDPLSHYCHLSCVKMLKCLHKEVLR